MVCVLAACGPPPRPDGPVDESVDARIVAAERGRGGVRLVFVGESGARLADLTAPPLSEGPAFVVDTQPAFSPDGRWVVFSSNRGAEATSLWVVEARADAQPRRLTRPGAGHVDRDPVWAPAGDAIVFASNRGGDTFDLWQLELSPGDDGWPSAAADPMRLTRDDADAVSPAVSPDGKWLAYARFDRAARLSTIWLGDQRARNARQLTEGPLDQTPAWSPDSEWVAYSAPAFERNDLDIFAVKRDGTRVRPMMAEPIAHETEPAWSADGRHLFATAVLRNEQTGDPFFWSVVVVDTEAPERVHALHDPSAVARVAFALAPAPLRSGALASLPPYDRATVLTALRDLCAEIPDERKPEACERLDR